LKTLPTNGFVGSVFLFIRCKIYALGKLNFFAGDGNEADNGIQEVKVQDLTGRVAMVTGGATGIGAAIIERLLACGASVACCYNKSQAAAEALEQKLNVGAARWCAVQVDVAEGDQVRAAVDAIHHRLKRPIDILVNNAGDMIETVPIADMPEELWDRVIDINLKGTFLCSKYCIPQLKQSGQGRIINLSSISARSGGGPGAAHYAASKGGVEALTRALAKELSPDQITCNAVAPGVVYTAIHERFNTPASLERLRQNIPLARLGTTAEVANLVSFLASDEAAYITGEIIAINGGQRMD
jgi:3-oxoacyl-[acyl-carrier protein] reductase